MKVLLETLPKPILLLGIGNTLKSDDAAGCEVVNRLTARGYSNCFDCRETPENYLSKIASFHAKSIVFVDAVEMNEKPGTVKMFTADRISNYGISTHGMSLSMLAQYLSNEGGAEIHLLGIQPKTIKLGESISDEVEKAVAKLVDEISG